MARLVQNQIGSCSFDLLSFNVRGLKDEKKRHSILRFLRRKRSDVCFLQETHSTLEDEDAWRNQWGGEIIFNHGTSNSRGVMILIRPCFDLKVIEVEKDNSGRLISLFCKIQGAPFRLYNLYGPNVDNQKLSFYKDLQKRLERDRDISESFIIGGDLNLIQNASLDRKGGNFKPASQYIQTLKVLESVKSDNDLVDIWRTKNPVTKRFTWRQKTPPIASRLDFWLVSLSLCDYIRDVDILPTIKSDHSPITLKIQTIDNSKGRGLWKLNNSFLEENEYVRGIIDIIQKTKEENEVNDKIVYWEYLKFKIREYSIHYGKERAKSKRDNERDLEERMKTIETQLDECENEGDRNVLVTQKNLIANELSAIDDYKTEGIIMRSKCEWYEKGEKSNSYFLRLAARNKIKTTMNRLKKEDGTETCNPNEILDMQKEFYKNLYSRGNTKSLNEKITYLDKFKVNSLSEEESKSCEGLLTADEIHKAIRGLKNNKSPGNDGLTGDFYKKFCGPITQPLLAALNAGYTSGTLSTSQRQAVISLLDKGKDRTLLKNWRPLSMLNTDYKIASKIIAERIKGHLSKLVHPNQVGYVEGRQISNNIRAISDIYHYTKGKNIPGILMNIDFEKAFDSVDWEFMKLVLRKFNFGDSLIRWIDVFYTDISSCVINNGFTTNYFNLQRGVRQGDPLSPYLFILVVEILACSVRQNKSIKGITINGVETKILQYADDTNGILSDTTSLRSFLKTVKEFGEFSGLKLNKGKSEAAWLGSLRNETTTPCGIAWPRDPLKFVGVFISYDQDRCNELNFGKRLEKCKQIVNEWKSRNLTMLGRALILRTFIISQFLFTCSAIEMPDRYLTELEKFMFDFLWKGRKSKLKRAVLYRKLEDGGVNMPDIRCMMKVNKIKWIQRYQSSESHLWKHCFRTFMKDSGIELDIVLRSNFTVNSLRLNDYTPRFYTDMLTSWSKITDTVDKKPFLWYNEDIKVDNRVIFYPKWHNAGFNFVHDLLTAEGNIKPFQALIDQGIDKGDWLKWQALVRIVKRESQKLSKKPEGLIPKLGGRPLQKLDSKSLYNIFIDKDTGSENICGRFTQRYFDTAEEYVDLAKKSFLGCKVFLTDVRLKEFQFKFLHDILVNNYWLEKWKIRGDALCTFCKSETENILHMYYECHEVLLFWNSLMNWLDTGQHFSKNLIFFGSDDPLFFLLSTCGKKYIYNCRMGNLLPTLPRFKLFLNEMNKKEFFEAKRRGTTDIYLNTWRPILAKLAH